MPDISQSKADEAAKQANTNDTVPPHLQARKLIRKQKTSGELKYKLWVAGHSACLAFGTISLIFQVLWLPNKWYINSICYRLSLLGSVVALVTTMSHKFGLTYLPEPTSLMAQQNFQFVILGAVWAVTFKSVLKLIPFYLLAVLQLADNRKLSAVLGQQDLLASVIAYDELALIVYLFLRTFFFRNTSGYQLVLYGLFYWLRILYNKETAVVFSTIIDKLDGVVQSKVKSEKALHYWDKSKKIIDAKSKGY